MFSFILMEARDLPTPSLFQKKKIKPRSIYKLPINDCRVKPALEKILLCRLFETDAQF
jgi:hypothetical protein